MPSNSQRVRFPGSLGTTLTGHLDAPAAEPRAYAIFAHCFTCSKDSKAARRICRKLSEQGIAVLRFDFTGLGESEGEFAETNFSSNIADLIAAADFLREQYQAPKMLVGHSLGGTASLVAAPKIPEVAAVATIAAPAGTDHLRKVLVEKASDLETGEQAEVELIGRKVTIKQQLLDDLESHAVHDAVHKLRKPLLIFHSPVDRVVGVDEARKLYEAALHPKSFLSLDGADHLLLDDPQDAEFVARALACWSHRYIAKPASAEEPELARGRVIAEGAATGYRTRITTATHEFIADEPTQQGGTDAGPNPYELLLAGLGACTTMTLRMYADRKEWPLEEIRAELKHTRVHADDCDDCESKNGKVDVIDRELTLTGDLSDEQRQRLLEIADRCPVSKTLTTETKVRTGFADG